MEGLANSTASVTNEAAPLLNPLMDGLAWSCLSANRLLVFDDEKTRIEAWKYGI